MKRQQVYQLNKYQYIHVLNENKVTQRLVTGPQTFILKAHETVSLGKTDMIEVHKMQYCKIQNPVFRDEDGNVDYLFGDDEHDGQARVRHGETEIRFHQEDPFPLYPGEKLVGSIQRLRTIPKEQAFKVKATRDFVDELVTEGKEENKRKAGDYWLVHGPKPSFIERVEVQLLGTVKSTIIREGQALMLQANRRIQDHNGKWRCAGERWLIRQQGSYLPRLDEQPIETCKGVILTQKTALQVRAKASFKDIYGHDRAAGEEWLVTVDDAQVHIVDVQEESVKTVYVTQLTKLQYCVVLDPYDKKSKCNKYGTKELRKGPCNFFLQPGETLEGGVQKVKVLGEQEALILKASQDCEDSDGTKHKAGEKWMITGPCEYIPKIEVEILQVNKAYTLTQNEGIYVRNLDTGEITAKIGETYMLKANEVLWQKELPSAIEELINQQDDSAQDYSKRRRTVSKREKWRVVKYKVPSNSAIQLFNYKTNEQEVIFGPCLILLQPHQEFTLIKLSGGTPKVEGKIKTLFMQLGPDFMTDIVVVETSDHAQLRLELCYNWKFEIDKSNEEDRNKLFQIEDFVGNCCKNIASRIRGAISGVAFEEFQKDSDVVMRKAVFGVDKKTNIIRNRIHFKANNLIITSVDVKQITPVDKEVQRNLDQARVVSMNMTTQSAKTIALHKAAQLDQKNKGKLKCQELLDQKESEKANQSLLKARAQTLKIQLSGKAKAKAEAEAKRQRILGRSKVEQAKLKAEEQRIKAEQELKTMKQDQEAQLKALKLKNDLEINKARKMSEIEIAKFQQIIGAIGKETLVAISKSGPEMKAKMLKGLGLKGFLVTDGKNPINLFNTANGMLGQMGGQQ